uniref:Eukaryotic translation initiation factor 5 n=1 Tax=Zeugodacus cucurbitae TaxID=28588 RepID=A0A0A1WVR1_ZEUCU
MKSKSVRKRQRSRRRARNAKIQNPDVKNSKVASSKPGPPNGMPVNDPVNHAATVWRGIYESLLIRQYEVKIEYWKQRALKLEEENRELRNELQPTIPVYETSSDEDDEEQRYLNGDYEYDDDDISPEYMEFRTVTLKHREELRKQRERELNPIVSTSAT